MSSIKFNLISNNVKGLQLCKKQLKMFKYLTNKRSETGILFLEEHAFHEGK